MTRGTKFVAVFWIVILVLIGIAVSKPHLSISLDDIAKIATVAGVLTAIAALIFTAFEYYRRKNKDIKDDRPYVMVSLESTAQATSLFDVVIRNIGNSAAKNINIVFHPNQLLLGGKARINELKILQNMKFLPQKEELRFFFGSYSATETEKSIKREYKIRVSYTDVEGRRYDEEFVSDPTDYEGLSTVATKSIHNVAKSLEELVKSNKEGVKSAKRLEETITENGLRIRNVKNRAVDRREILNQIVNLYANRSKNEMWLNPFIYDFKLMIRQGRDSILTQDILSDYEKKLVEELNYLLEKDWNWDDDEVNAHFETIASIVVDQAHE